jgi:hypothetical protein
METKKYAVKKTRVLADGTVKEYTCMQQYTLKGYIGADGNRRTKYNLTDIQMAEIREKLSRGIKRKQIIEEYKISYMYLNKMLANIEPTQ